MDFMLLGDSFLLLYVRLSVTVSARDTASRFVFQLCVFLPGLSRALCSYCTI